MIYFSQREMHDTKARSKTELFDINSKTFFIFLEKTSRLKEVGKE